MKCEFNELKVKGVFDEFNVKNYIIRTPDNVSYVALRLPNGKYRIGDDGVNRTLKECKALVADDAVEFFADKCTKVAPDNQEKGTWSCVNPCALLIKMINEMHFEYVEGDLFPEIERTLEAYGWKTPEGDHDIDLANTDYNTWRENRIEQGN